MKNAPDVGHAQNINTVIWREKRHVYFSRLVLFTLQKNGLSYSVFLFLVKISNKLLNQDTFTRLAKWLKIFSLVSWGKY